MNAIAPGALNTRLLEEVLAAGLRARSSPPGFEPATALAVFLGSAASDGISGRLIAAQWDDWQSLRAPLPDDLYPLREEGRVSIREATLKATGVGARCASGGGRLTYTREFLDEAAELARGLPVETIEGMVAAWRACASAAGGCSSSASAAAPATRRTPSTTSARSAASRPTRPPTTSRS